jgi:dipeptidyl aminopeptidase/acylaminoacyl peptidase
MTGARSRPFTVDDLLKNEAFGDVRIDPRGRWLVFEHRVGIDALPRTDMTSYAVQRSRLMRVDLRVPGPARPLLAADDRAGSVVLGFSPGGTRLAIGRLRDRVWQLGVVTMADATVHWFDVTPAYDSFHATLAWRDEHHLITLAEPTLSLPWSLRVSTSQADALPARWAASSSGRAASVTIVGSGRYATLTPHVKSEQLIDLDVTTGHRRLLATGDLVAIALSRDHRYIALTEQTDLIAPNPTQPAMIGTDVRRRRLSIIDVTSGADWVPCPPCDVIASPPRWSPDSHALLFYARTGGEEWGDGRLWRADVVQRRIRPIDLNGLRPVISGLPSLNAMVTIGWIGTKPLLYARQGASARADWYGLGAGRPVALSATSPQTSDQLVNTAHGPLMLAGAEASPLRGYSGKAPLREMDAIIAVSDAKDDAANVRLLGWRHSASGTRLALHNDRQPDIQIVGPTGATPKAVSLATGQVATETTLPDGEAQLVLLSHGRAPVTLASINSHLRGVDAPSPIPVQHRLPDGAAVTSWLYLPPPAAGHAKPPLIVIPYPGLVFGSAAPSGWGPASDRFYTAVPALVGHGYAVLLPSMPSLAASDHDAFPFAGQVLAAVDAVLAQQRVDPDRLGLWGHSFGGFTAATIAGQTTRFRAMVASSGIYDLASFRGMFTPATRVEPGYGGSMTTIAGWTETGQPALGASPWTNALRYTTNSPVYHADRITTPILLVGGDEDFAGIGQSEEMFSALYRQNKDAELLTYWGADHTLVSPADLRDVYARVFAWFDGHFAGPAPQALAMRIVDRPRPPSTRADRRVVLLNTQPSVQPTAP